MKSRLNDHHKPNSQHHIASFRIFFSSRWTDYAEINFVLQIVETEYKKIPVAVFLMNQFRS